MPGASERPCHKGTSWSYTWDAKRPDRMTQIPRRSGKLLVWDVTVVSTTAESYVAAAARGQGEVAEMAGTRKCQKYSELSTAYKFLPIAVGTLGPINDSAYEFFEMLGRKITDVSGDSREVSFLFQRLSVIIQRLTRPCEVTRSLPTTIRPFQLLLINFVFFIVFLPWDIYYY